MGFWRAGSTTNVVSIPTGIERRNEFSERIKLKRYGNTSINRPINQSINQSIMVSAVARLIDWLIEVTQNPNGQVFLRFLKLELPRNSPKNQRFIPFFHINDKIKSASPRLSVLATPSKIWRRLSGTSRTDEVTYVEAATAPCSLSKFPATIRERGGYFGSADTTSSTFSALAGSWTRETHEDTPNSQLRHATFFLANSSPSFELISPQVCFQTSSRGPAHQFCDVEFSAGTE